MGATLHIEHPISDLSTWLEAFARFDDARRNAGVTAHRVRHPVDDERCIVVDLDFETIDAAQAFHAFLEQVVWQSADLSPALAGTPTARALTDINTGSTDR